MDWQPGTTLRGRYDIEARVGEHTWRVRDNRTGARLACRVYELSPRADVEVFQAALELRRALQLPGIPKVVDIAAEVHGGRTAFLMFRQWIDGTSLREMVVERGPRSYELASHLGQMVLDALWGLHGQDPPLFHGDLNPDHVIEDEQGALHLVGLAGPKAASGLGWRRSIDPEFGAPEALMGEPKPRSDYYSLGGLLVYLVLGETTDLGTSPTESMQARGIPRAFSQVCERLLEPLVERRYADLEAVSEALARGAGREREEEEDEEDDDEASTVLAKQTPRLADHLERLVPFIPEQFRLAALGGALFLVVVVAVATVGAFLRPSGGDVDPSERADHVDPSQDGIQLDVPLSCPGGMEFKKVGPDIRCVDKHGEMVMVPGVRDDRPPFLADRLELSVARYADCVDEGACSPRPDECASRDAEPATCLTLEQATAVCLAQRRRLCTDDEFRWLNTFHDNRPHPWGDAPADCSRAWTADCGSAPAVPGRPDGANAQGVEDLQGNVLEFLASGQLGDGAARSSPADASPDWVGVRCCRDLD